MFFINEDGKIFNSKTLDFESIKINSYCLKVVIVNAVAFSIKLVNVRNVFIIEFLLSVFFKVSEKTIKDYLSV